MEIILPNKSIFNTEKSFDNQTQDCQDYFFEVMNASEPTTIVDDFNRPLTQSWEVLAIGFEVVRITEYATQCGDWNFKNQYHVTNRTAWHEDKEYQVIMSEEQFTEISLENIQFVYDEANKRKTYKEGVYLYQYPDVVLPEHRAYLESKGVKIYDKNQI